jgi:hypothetical protein
MPIGNAFSGTPTYGLDFTDGIVRSDIFLRGEPWNFSYILITILNACLLGTLHNKGLEVTGMLSSLYMLGSKFNNKCFMGN